MKVYHETIDTTCIGGLTKGELMGNEVRKRKLLSEVAALRPDRQVSRWAYMAEFDVGYVEAFNELYRVVHSTRVLPKKYRELIISVLLASRLAERLPTHLERALDAGASEAELLEALQLSQMIFGAPSLLFGVDALQAVVKKRKARKR
jgi:alkylhydroperoxidase/carboxymuconolactone decarboxylase family protein YurZ